MHRGEINLSWYRLAKAVVGAVLRLWFRLEVVGAHLLPARGPVVVCANHRSYWDPPLVGWAMRRPARFLAKEELLRMPLLGRLMASLGAIPVRRGAADLGGIRRAVEALRGGAALVVFPEGTRNRSGRALLAGHPGAAYLALTTGAPIVPVAVSGSLRFRGRVRIIFGEALDAAGEAAGAGTRQARALAVSESVMRRLDDLLARTADRPAEGAGNA